MRSKSYYFIITLICTLLFTVHTKAATSYVSTTGTDGNGNTLTITANRYTSIPYDEESQIENANGGLENVFKWNLTQNISISGFTRYHYYTGLLYFKLNFGKSSAILTQGSVSINNINIDDGLKAYLNVGDGFIVVNLIFDNYYTTTSEIGIPSILYDFYVSRTSYTDAQLYASFATTLTSVSASNLTHHDYPNNGGLAQIISTMVGYAINSASEFDDIITILGTIRDQDPVYYNQIISGLGTLHVDITNLINEIDLDFQQVQTVLDLFPSYRTQVLQYWQELLAMNAAQSSQAAEMESQYANQGAQSETLLNGLNSLNLPDVNPNDFNLLGQVDTTQKTNFFGLISLITNNSIVTTILLIIVTGAIVGYILYGKK